MNNKVKVTADATGCIIGISPKNPEYGYIRVQQERGIISNDGWLKRSVVSALIRGKVEDLQDLNLKAGQELNGRIVIREQTLPFNTINPDKHIKVAGATGVACRYYDEPIYRETFYTPNSEAEDQLIPHTNMDEIKAAQLNLKIKNSGLNLTNLMNNDREAREAVL